MSSMLEMEGPILAYCVDEKIQEECESALDCIKGRVLQNSYIQACICGEELSV